MFNMGIKIVLLWAYYLVKFPYEYNVILTTSNFLICVFIRVCLCIDLNKNKQREELSRVSYLNIKKDGPYCYAQLSILRREKLALT